MLTSQQVKEKIDSEWGTFRRWIARNPLTGFWTGNATGAIALVVLLHYVGKF